MNKVLYRERSMAVNFRQQGRDIVSEWNVCCFFENRIGRYESAEHGCRNQVNNSYAPALSHVKFGVGNFKSCFCNHKETLQAQRLRGSFCLSRDGFFSIFPLAHKKEQIECKSPCVLSAQGDFLMPQKPSWCRPPFSLRWPASSGWSHDRIQLLARYIKGHLFSDALHRIIAWFL